MDEEQNVQNIPAEEDSNKMQERREEFDRVAEKLKGAIRQKDKSWLDNLVHANSSNASKRILLTKLMEENHQHISRELAAIRFSGRCLNIQENNGNNETQPIDLIDNMEETVDFKDLPDDLFVQIEDFIKKEMQVDDQSEDEIEEVPVPPKPPVPLVTLDENDEVRLKSRSELVDIDVNNAKILQNKYIFIGNAVSKELKKLGLDPSDKQISWLFKAAIRFHQVAIQYLQKYFGTALRSSLMENFSALGQNKQTHVSTPRRLQRLATKYSKVIENIDPVNGADKIKSEINEYNTDEDIKCFEGGMDYEKFWFRVADITEGSAGWKRYKILPLFAIALSVKFNSNSEVERSFSLMNHIHQNRQRNCISQFTLNSMMHVKSNISCKESQRTCDKCRTSSKPHCHCSEMEITDNLRAECKKSNSKYAEYLKDKKGDKECLTDEMKAKRKVVEEEVASRLEKKRKFFRKVISVLLSC